MHLFVPIRHGENILIKSEETTDHCDLLTCFSVSLQMKDFRSHHKCGETILNWKTLMLSFRIDSSSACNIRAGEKILMVTLAVAL